MFVDTTNGNYHLLASSQLINAGHPDSTDSDGTIADMGAYPFLNSYSGPTWYVSATAGNDTTATGASDAPFHSIQSAINFATTTGDSVTVAAGTYVENINFRGRNIKVVGADRETTIIDGNQAGSVVVFENGEDSTAVLTGFTIQNGLASYSGGISPSHSDPTLDNLIIQNNTATSSGGGISFYYSRSKLINSIVRNNHANYNGGGLALAYAPVKIINTLITNNTCTNNGAGINVHNENHKIINCTIVGNSPDGLGGGIRLAQDAHVVLLNSIIHSNENGNIRLKLDSNDPKSITISYSDIQDGESGIEINDN
jgi:parallel beta-helix repeat protein